MSLVGEAQDSDANSSRCQDESFCTSMCRKLPIHSVSAPLPAAGQNKRCYHSSSWNSVGNRHKMLAVKRADGVVAALCLVACVLVPDVAGCSGNLSVSGWQLPSDKSAIVSEMPAKPYKAHGLPDGTVSVWTKYRPGFRFRRPDGNGFWEFRDASKISYNGRVFAIVATAY